MKSHIRLIPKVVGKQFMHPSPQAASATSIREHNLSLVLNLIHRNGSISRSDIIHETDLSATTVSALVNVLMQSGFIRQGAEGASSGGRRPIMLEFNYKSRRVIGIDMGASHITVLAMDLHGEVEARESRKFDVINHPQDALEVIVRMVHQVMTTTGLRSKSFMGIGMTVPAPLTGENLDQMVTYYMPAWDGISPADELRHKIDIPVYVENDANAAAVGEKWWGSGKNYEDMAYIKLGIGVGSGIVLNNQVYRGNNGTAGEIGHTTLDVNGRACRCGNTGCMESYVGGPGLIKDVVDGYQHLGKPLPFAKNFGVDDIVHAAMAGDPVCQGVIQNAGRYLGIAIANLLNLVNPGLVILGGDLVEANDLLLTAVRQSIEERAMPIKAQHAEIKLGLLGANAVAIGAGTLVIHNAFLPSNLFKTLNIL
jgi:predicted NBD/HSP70 family sugar kinase